MKEAIGAFVALGTAFIGASIVYQVVKKDSQGPKVVDTVVGGLKSLSGDLFKG